MTVLDRHPCPDGFPQGLWENFVNAAAIIPTPITPKEEAFTDSRVKTFFFCVVDMAASAAKSNVTIAAIDVLEDYRPPLAEEVCQRILDAASR